MFAVSAPWDYSANTLAEVVMGYFGITFLSLLAALFVLATINVVLERKSTYDFESELKLNKRRDKVARLIMADIGIIVLLFVWALIK